MAGDKRPVLILNCPHATCGAQNSAFYPTAEWPTSSSPIYDVLAFCGGCREAVMVRLSAPQERDGNFKRPMNCVGNLKDIHKFVVGPVWPEPPESNAPAHTPAGIARFYTQAAKALSSGLCDAAGAMARKTIDVATRQLKPEEAFAQKKLVARIDALANEHILVPALKEWAHAIRLDGNDATHDPDPFTPEEAKRIVTFTEMFLRFVYTLPGDLEERRKGTEPEAKQA